MEQTKYDVFISYSRKDYVDEQKNIIPGNEVAKIKNALSKADITYWFDEDGIYSGQNFVEKIVTNIENASIFLFLSSANSNKSPWTCKEIASADEFKKHIIPVRIDSSPYNKKVLFRIADLDYIDYYTNPQKGLEDMLKSIKSYMEELAKAEKIKQEEENKQKEQERKRKEELKLQQEQEEKRRQEEQQRLVLEIKLSCTTLNNEETKLELDRENLLLQTEKISNDDQRKLLLDLINNGGAIHKKYQERYFELTKEIDTLKSTGIESLKVELESKEKKILQLESELSASKLREHEHEMTSNRLIGQIGNLQKQDIDGTVKNHFKTSKRVHIIYWFIIVSVLICAISWIAYVNNESQSWEYRYNRTWDELRESKEIQETFNLLSKYTPFIITDIEIKNDGEEWGDKIYSSKSTYFIPRIKYIGLKEGKYKLMTKIYNNESKLSHNDEISPTGYTNLTDVSISNGENYEELTGWGNEQLGNWAAGTYRIEIWYMEKKLSEKTFRVY